MAKIKNNDMTTVKLSKEASAMLSEIAESMKTDKCEILEKFVKCLHGCFDYAEKDSYLAYSINPLEGKLEIFIQPREQWVLTKKKLLEPILKDRALREKKPLKGD